MPGTRVESDITGLSAILGQDAVSDWMELTQEMVSAFAEITHDRQWIHVNAERAQQQSPYGTTIAHGFLTLALISPLMRDAIHVTGGRMTINYGLNNVRFPAPLPTGSRVRGRFTLQQVEPVDDAVQATWRAIVEREGTDKPCCAAEWVVRYYP